MIRVRFFHHCKIILLTVLVIAAAGGVCGLFWLNQNGFGGEWGKRITDELSKRGIHAVFDEARYSPLRGMLVREAVFYTGPDKTKVFAHIPKLRIDIDRSKAIRGELVLRELVLQDADIYIPLISPSGDPSKPSISQLSGSVTLDRQGRFILRDGSGSLGGMNFLLDAEFDDFSLNQLADTQEDDSDRDARARFLRNLFAEASRWTLHESAPPQLELILSGNFSKPSTIEASFSLKAPELARNGYTMEQVHVAGEFLGRHLTFDAFQFTHGTGELKGRAGYDLKDRDGRFEFISSIHLSQMLGDCFGYHELDVIVSPRAPTIKSRGDFQVAPDGSISLGAIGTVKMPAFRYEGTSYEGLQTEFSWRDGNTFLRDLHVTHKDGSLKGRVRILGDTIRYSVDSTLPVSAFNVFIAENSGLAKIINRAGFNDTSAVHLVADGDIRRSDLKDWSSTGSAEFTNLTYNGVPLKSLKANYAMTPAEHIYTDIKGRFDYGNYPLRRRHGGPASALVQADRISYDRVSNLTRISKLRGDAWPAPVLRLFNPKAATHVEQTYRFRSPPSFVANGLVGHPTPTRRPNTPDTTRLTDVTTALRTTSNTNYTFLDRDLSLSNLQADIRYRHRQVDVTRLKGRTFGGPIGGKVHISLSPGKPSSFNGGIHWTRLRFAEIGDTFDFGKADQGYVTGRFDFRGRTDTVRALNGTGAIGLERGHLFFVPVLGPLSPILGDVLGDKRASHEEARDASCTFAIKNGVFLTRDFLTSTPSTVFTGDGSIDLDRKTIDMTIRMNARGLFGLITLPLRPFNGLFQFRGQGTLNNPVWKNAPFVNPPDGRNDPLFRKPGKAVVIPNRAQIIPDR